MICRMLYVHLYLQRLVFDVEKPPFIQVPDSGDGQILLSAEKEKRGGGGAKIASMIPLSYVYLASEWKLCLSFVNNWLLDMLERSGQRPLRDILGFNINVMLAWFTEKSELGMFWFTEKSELGMVLFLTLWIWFS